MRLNSKKGSTTSTTEPPAEYLVNDPKKLEFYSLHLVFQDDTFFRMCIAAIGSLMSRKSSTYD